MGLLLYRIRPSSAKKRNMVLLIRDRTGRWLAICAAAVALAFACQIACAVRAQVVDIFDVNVEASAGKDGEDAKRPFRLAAQSTENTEALADFNRHMKRGTWERAFKSLEKVQGSKPDALVPRADGFYIPSRTYLRQLLAALPQDGKDAYRLFYDPEAKKLLEEAKGKNELASLTKLVNEYFITTVGDVAADRLGDLEFERGDVEQAAERWQSILQYRPESVLKRAQLLVKSAIALARAGRWDEVRRAARELRERHAGETAIVGGRKVNALSYVSGLSPADPSAKISSGSNSASGSAAEMSLPASSEPLWQFKILSQANAQALASMGNDWGWGRIPAADAVPPTAVDEDRVYANFLGFLFALDVKTGKLLWRNAKFHDIVQQLRNNQLLLPEQYGLCLVGDRLYTVGRESGKVSQQGAPFLLNCHEKSTGKQIWSSQKISSLKPWRMWGAPTASGDRVYITAIKNQQQRDLHLLAISAADGKLLWATPCGTYQVDESQLYNQRSSQPTLAIDGDRLFVDTHVGAVVLLDAKTGATRWGLNYEAEAPNTQYWYNSPRPLLTVGGPLVENDVLYVKGMRSTRLVAVQLAGPTLLFKRPVGGPAMLIGVDSDRLYLGGDEIEAVDLKTQKLLWATKVPIATPWTRAIMTKNRLFQFTPRGIFEIDKASGDVVARHRGGDLDSLGGVLLHSKQTLVTVSNLSITAYALQGSGAAAGGGQGSGAEKKAASTDTSTGATPAGATPTGAAGP
jgi:outer membrane protein assembly factor BamB